MAKCPTCSGRGRYIMRGLAEQICNCELCNGTGEVKICPSCRGKGQILVRGLCDITYDCEYCGGTGVL